MADPADMAQSETEAQEELRMRQHRAIAQRHSDALKVLSGFCLNCDEPQPTQRYCDAECQKDHEIRLRARGQRL